MALAENTAINRFSIVRILASAGNAVLNWSVAMAESNVKYKKMQYLMSLSDEDLAKRGLKREEIAARIFAGSYWV